MSLTDLVLYILIICGMKPNIVNTAATIPTKNQKIMDNQLPFKIVRPSANAL